MRLKLFFRLMNYAFSVWNTSINKLIAGTDKIRPKLRPKEAICVLSFIVWGIGMLLLDRMRGLGIFSLVVFIILSM